ncbi:unnamed protein product [Darwinula stevensoni]|uniref:Uncharacterized protein n=1 Tax=Darwinula stevensoni TaxID=69355 RepID=A0A7R9A8Y5_9CRUS|nr:unnamed protein product [Darwinula stevensoni]CAG0896773.1 unnamed protein product [Darwinula stevensoni]
MLIDNLVAIVTIQCKEALRPSQWRLVVHAVSIERREFTDSSSYDGSDEDPLDSLLDTTMRGPKKKKKGTLPHQDPLNAKKKSWKEKLRAALTPRSFANYLKTFLIICGCAVSTVYLSMRPENEIKSIHVSVAVGKRHCILHIDTFRS